MTSKCESRIDRAEEVKGRAWMMELNGTKPKPDEQWLLDTQSDHVFIVNVAASVSAMLPSERMERA
jgi:hypothetical protein